VTPPPWKTVPMPKYIARLPRTSSGMPVVYITEYDGFDGSNFATMSTLTDSVGLNDCGCTFGEGRPLIGKQCLHRQHKAMTERRCGVCGRRLGPAAELIFVGVEKNMVEGHGPDTYTSIEAPTHNECTHYSALTCPRLYADPARITLAITRHYEIRYRVVAGFGPQGQVMAALIPPEYIRLGTGMVDMFIAVPKPSETRIVTLDRWLATEARPLTEGRQAR
jgi:hypothetical protein